MARAWCSAPPRLVRPSSPREVCPSYATWLRSRWSDGWLTLEELTQLAGAVVRFARGH